VIGLLSKELISLREVSSVTVATHAHRDERYPSKHLPYPLHSSSQSSLLLRSPLRTPKC
jgi:hypothetical protein